mmetsp:Transcript_22543/g.49832  ORF Transcript_22543/g.49832 Transcript_22543/m.49832 type:complete len:164 (+) Transcript_22543:3-494(+)
MSGGGMGGGRISGGTSWGKMDAPSSNPSGVDILTQALMLIPPQVAQDPRGFALRCAVPDRLVGGLLGPRGMVAKEVCEWTGSRVDVPQVPSDSGVRPLSITGPLFSNVAAYIYMMKQYIDVEASSHGGGGSNALWGNEASHMRQGDMRQLAGPGGQGGHGWGP